MDPGIQAACACSPRKIERQLACGDRALDNRDVSVFLNGSYLSDAKRSHSWNLDHLDKNTDPKKRNDILEYLVEDYRDWMEENSYLVFDVQKRRGINRRVAVLAAKRGNSVYRYRTRKRFDSVEELFPDKNIVDPHCNVGFIAQTNILFVTLEFAKEDLSVKEAWERAPKEFDRFEKSLRKVYPLAFIRGFEAHKDGYPHIHVLIVFQDKSWRMKRHLATRGKNRGTLTWRLADYGVKISEFEQRWRNGFVDVWGVTNPKRGGLNYILKYICGEKSKREGRLDYFLSLIHI